MSDTTKDVVENILTHYGAKGMKWGVRKSRETSSLTVKGLDKFPKETGLAVNNVAQKMNSAYGFKLNEVVPMHKKKYIAYVKLRNNNYNAIHMTTRPDLKEFLGKLEKKNWLVNSNGHTIESNLTHESAHAMFHSANVAGKGFFDRNFNLKQPIDGMRKSAWAKAEKQAIADGDVKTYNVVSRVFHNAPEFQMAKKLSRYGYGALFSEEREAEIFTAYHWSSNPPKFVDTFVNDIHSNMGVKVQPFSGRKVRNA